MITIVAFLLFLLRLTSAVPFYQLPRNLPREITHIAHDEERGLYHAYRSDDSLYGTYLAGNHSVNAPSDKREEGPSCPPISIEELKSMGSWNKIEAFANEKWGEGKRKAAVNLPEFEERPARTCVDSEPVSVERGRERCSETTLSVNGTMLGTNGTIRVIVTQRYSNAISGSVTKATKFAIGAKVWATFQVPLVSSVGVELSKKTSILNEKTSTYESRKDSAVNQEVWIEAPDGKRCGGYVTTKSCTSTAKSRVRFTIEGWVWFIYDHAKKGRKKWAVPLESALSIDERSDWLEMEGNMRSSATANYGGRCK
ncbi:hypothetical protein BD779DRAFT_1789572 [Infundibulicybe gibba]|nr:hypothetical protein BD779DRAFT_1789572 [Infundibulicybe gibba]